MCEEFHGIPIESSLNSPLCPKQYEASDQCAPFMAAHFSTGIPSRSLTTNYAVHRHQKWRDLIHGVTAMRPMESCRRRKDLNRHACVTQPYRKVLILHRENIAGPPMDTLK